MFCGGAKKNLEETKLIDCTFFYILFLCATRKGKEKKNQFGARSSHSRLHPQEKENKYKNSSIDFERRVLRT